MRAHKTMCSIDDVVILTGVCNMVELPVHCQEHLYFSNKDARLHLAGWILEYQ